MHYRRDGEATESLYQVKAALRPLRRLYGYALAGEFGPRSLKTVRQSMIDSGLSRGVINKRIGIIKQAFKWGVGEELVPPSVHHGLQAVVGLQKGRTEAPEPERVGPVPHDLVDATLDFLGSIVADMVRFQRLTGCRPGEVCILRPCDVDRSGDVWEYRPESHKTEHQGRSRIILIGPTSQGLLAPYLLRPTDAYCFSPKDTVKRQLDERQAKRRTPLSCGNRPGTNRRRKPKRSPANRYTRDSYRRAIHRACDKAGVERWSPNRLRHSTGTEIRKRYGLEGAQVVLGHARADVTQVYAERNLELAVRIARECG
ncbi:MAG: tyrosine-type recombinase/integrase [Planctomycetota bacterium]|jgi:integrase